MVDATQFEDLELYRDPNNSDRFIARDPSDESIYAIPFEEIESTDATITNSLTVTGTTTTDALEAESATIGNTLFENNTLSLADDVSGSVRVSKDQYIWVLGNDGGVSANFQSTFDLLNTIIVGNNVTNQGGGIVLNGSTGPDGTVNISRDGNDLYIENRSGQSVTVDILRLNR